MNEVGLVGRADQGTEKTQVPVQTTTQDAEVFSISRTHRCKAARQRGKQPPPIFLARLPVARTAQMRHCGGDVTSWSRACLSNIDMSSC